MWPFRKKKQQQRRVLRSIAGSPSIDRYPRENDDSFLTSLYVASSLVDSSGANSAPATHQDSGSHHDHGGGFGGDSGFSTGGGFGGDSGFSSGGDSGGDSGGGDSGGGGSD